MRQDFSEERKKWKDLGKEEKIQYFFDYYLLKSIVLLAVVLVLGLLLRGFLFPEAEPVLYVAVFDLTLDSGAEEQMIQELEENLKGNLKGKEQDAKILIDDSFRSDEKKDIERLQVLLANHKADVVVANDEIIKTLAGFGYFRSLESLFGKEEIEKWKTSGCLLETEGYQDSEEMTFEENGTGKGEKKPYAVLLKYSKKWETMAEELHGYIDFAIVEECSHPKNAVSFLKYLEE